MPKKAALAAIALLMTSSSLACAAETSSTVGMRNPSAADIKSLTDMRVGLVKAALQRAVRDSIEHRGDFDDDD